MRTALREPSRTTRRDPAIADAGDARLLEQARTGDEDAYGELYRRHADAALRLARQLTRSPAAAEDLVGDAFAAVLVALRNGSGPTEAFRPYLLTTVRRRSWRAGRRPEEPVDPTASDAGLDLAVLDADGDDARLLVDAYRSLPERWQLVLWHTEVEGRPPAEVAPLVGLSPHATAALAHRAREGLREAFLQAHLREDAVPAACRTTVAALGALVRGRAGARDRARADEHLAGCERCRQLRTELVDVNRALRGVIGPLVLGSAAAAYLGTRSGAAASSTVASGGAAGRATGLRAAAAGTLVAAALAALLLATDLVPRDEPQSVAREQGAAAAPPQGATVAAPGVDAPTVRPALTGGGVLRSVATDACAADLGVAVTAAAAGTDPGTEATATVVRAVLVPADTAGLALPDVAGVLRPVTGALAGALRGLVTGPPGDGVPPVPVPTAATGGTCVRVAPSALLAGDGAWALLVAFLPAGAGAVDDLQFAVLGRPLALLGPTARTAIADARTTLADGLRALGDLATVPSGAARPDDAVDALTGSLPGPAAGDVLAPLGGDPGTGTTGGTTTDPVLPGLPAVTDPLAPVVTVPPLTLPTLPALPLP